MVVLGEGEEMSWDGERGSVGGGHDFKNNNNYSKKTNNARGKKHTQARERRGEQKKLRGTQGPPTN